jgi:hypothetical protein
MPKRTKKHVVRKTVLRLPNLDHAKTSVLNSLSSPRSRRNYKFAMEQFIDWYCSEPRLALNRTVVLRFRLHPRIARTSRRNDQSEACGGQKAGLRSGGLGSAESGTCCGHTARQRRQTTRMPCG